jgi:mono/diheme cytochrome c family protein
MKAVGEYLKTLPRVHVERTNSGMAMLPGRDGRLQPVRFGFPGKSDFFGWMDLECPAARWARVENISHGEVLLGRTCSACGGAGRIARLVAIEVKAAPIPGRSSPKATAMQQAFLDLVKNSGGLAACVSSVEEVHRLLEGA